MCKTFLLIVNPTSGRCLSETTLRYFQEICQKNNVKLSRCELNQSVNLGEVIKSHNNLSTVVACGGDGTIAAVANCLVGKNISLAIVPCGTANILAKEFEIPLNPTKAFNLIFSAHGERLLDAMNCGSHYLFSHLSFGAYPAVLKNTDTKARQKFGRIVYAVSLLKLLWSSPVFTFPVTIDGVSHSVKATTLMIVNCSRMAFLGLKWDPDARPDDGRVSLCFVKAKNMLEYFVTLFDFLRQTQRCSRMVDVFEAKASITFENPNKLSIRGDGEFFGDDAIRVQIAPASVRVIVPNTARG